MAQNIWNDNLQESEPFTRTNEKKGSHAFSMRGIRNSLGKGTRMNRSGNNLPAQKDVLISEKRKHPRFRVEFPVDCSRIDGTENYGGMVGNVSEEGMLVHLPERLEKGDLLRIEIFFLEDWELSTIKAIAKVIWYDLEAKIGWAEHQHGLQFQSIYKEDLSKLKILLNRMATVETKNKT
jgi:hypothetical protein